MGGSGGFAGLLVFLFDSQWPLFCYIYQVSWHLGWGLPYSQYIDVICVVLEEWGALVATTKAFNPPMLARKVDLPLLSCSIGCLLIVRPYAYDLIVVYVYHVWWLGWAPGECA